MFVCKRASTHSSRTAATTLPCVCVCVFLFVFFCLKSECIEIVCPPPPDTGTNPIAIAAPATDGDSMILDMATTGSAQSCFAHQFCFVHLLKYMLCVSCFFGCSLPSPLPSSPSHFPPSLLAYPLPTMHVWLPPRALPACRARMKNALLIISRCHRQD